MLSAETHRGNREAVREGSYGRFLYNFYRTYDPDTGRYLEGDLIQPARPHRVADAAEVVIPDSDLGEYALISVLPYRIEWAGLVDPATGRFSDLGSTPAAISTENRYAYVGNDSVNWIDPLGDSKTEGITRGADPFLAKFRAAQGNKEAICKLEQEAKKLLKTGSQGMTRRRYNKVRAWAKLARRNQLSKLVPAACSFSSLCVCARQPESCAAMFED